MIYASGGQISWLRIPIRSYFRCMDILGMEAGYRQTLGRDRRLKSRKRIAALFATGERMQVRELRVRHLSAPDREGGVQAGFTASSRVFRRAVDRNRVKRLMREAWRRQVGPLEAALRPGTGGVDVFLIFAGRELPDFGEVHAQVAKVIEWLKKRYSDAV